MEIILLEKIANLGQLGEKVNVRAGYGRNFLIPTGKAVPATPDNIKKFEERRADLEKTSAEATQFAEQRKSKIEELASVTIVSKAGAEGRLFGSVGTNDIADAIQAAGVEVERREVRMPEGPIRQIGEHEVELHLHTEVDAKIKVVVEPE